MSSLWTKLVNLVIRPPRAEYDPEECLPGPRFRIGGVAHCRRDLELEGAEGYRIQCSHYEPERRGPEPLPCVVYLHGNSGSRCDATEAIRLLLPARITIFAVDLSGSGLSEGEYVTLGAREVLDVEAIVHHLREQGRTSKIGIWGQSMVRKKYYKLVRVVWILVVYLRVLMERETTSALTARVPALAAQYVQRSSRVRVVRVALVAS